MRTPSIFKQKKGVTLIELLVALAIFGIVIGAIYRLFIVQTKAYTVQDQAVEVQQNVRSAMEILLRDLRMTGYDDDNTASTITITAPILTPVQASDITVSYEYYNSTAVPPQYELHTVRYWTDASSTLSRAITVNPPGGTTTETLLQNVDNLTFTYGIDTNDDGVVDDQNGDNIIDERDFVQAASVGASKVIAVQVTLTGRPDQTNPDVRKSVSPRTLTSAVTLRNLIMK
jgi:type IV pilus assembly protein PilW